MGELDGRVAVVTGGGRGIGRAIAARLAEAGARVLITGRDPARGGEAAQALGPDVRFHAHDASDPAGWPAVMAAAEALGPVEIVIANAGVSQNTPAAEMTLEEFRAVTAVNLKGVFLALRHGVLAMRKHQRGGAFVLVSSIVGKIGVAGYTHYAAAKGGVRLMAKAAALELGPENIRVNSLHPGMVRTDMTAPFPEEAFKGIAALQRFADPAEIAEAAFYLVSPRGAFVTGTELVVDGGAIVQ